MLAKMPFPNGEYLVAVEVGAYNHWKASIKTYITIS